MFRQILLSILLLLLVATAGATDVNGEYIIFGSGTWSCQEAVRKATQDDPMWYGMLVGWLGGYLTATHYQMDTTYALTLDFNSAYAWMMDYCRRNPVEKVS